MITQEHRDWVEKVLAEHDVPPLPDDAERGHHLLGWTDATARPQIDIAFQHSPSLLVNALGPPPKDIVDTAHEHGIKVAALASSPRHAQKHVEHRRRHRRRAGHRGGRPHRRDQLGRAVAAGDRGDRADTPVLAAGGIAHGSQIAAALAMGAQGVWTGSIWLTVAESDMTPLVIEKLLAADSTQTVRSRALIGQARAPAAHRVDRRLGPPRLPGLPPDAVAVHARRRRDGPRRPRASNRELTGMPVGQVVGMMNQRAPGRATSSASSSRSTSKPSTASKPSTPDPTKPPNSW